MWQRERVAAADHAPLLLACGSCLLRNKPNATLPAPTKIWSEARDLIVDSVLRERSAGHRARLARLDLAAARWPSATGLAGVIGIALGTIIGQSVWAMRGA